MVKEGPDSFSLDPEKKIESVLFFFSPLQDSYSLDSLWGVIFPQMYG